MIGGTQVAALSGRIAGLGLVHDLGACSQSERDSKASPLLKRRATEMRIHSLLDVAYPPYPEGLLPQNGVTVCQCAGVKAQEVRAVAAERSEGPTHILPILDKGRERYHARTCAPIVARILADERGDAMDDASVLRTLRPSYHMTRVDLARHLDAQDTTCEVKNVT